MGVHSQIVLYIWESRSTAFIVFLSSYFFFYLKKSINKGYDMMYENKLEVIVNNIMEGSGSSSIVRNDMAYR
jgi:hypothetical protein